VRGHQCSARNNEGKGQEFGYDHLGFKEEGDRKTSEWWIRWDTQNTKDAPCAGKESLSVNILSVKKGGEEKMGVGKARR